MYKHNFQAYNLILKYWKNREKEKKEKIEKERETK
jgi:hypothetical protein